MPSTPYIISGTVYDSDQVTPTSGATVTLTDETTNESISTTTNALGQYIMDMTNLASGPTTDGFIKIVVSGSGTNGKDLRYKAVLLSGHGEISKLKISYEV